MSSKFIETKLNEICRRCLEDYGRPCCDDSSEEGGTVCGMLEDANEEYESWLAGKKRSKRRYTVKIFFAGDGGMISVDCDDFGMTDRCIYTVVKDGLPIMTMPIGNVKYTTLICNHKND